jgi:hypothetical protein
MTEEQVIDSTAWKEEMNSSLLGKSLITSRRFVELLKIEK